MSVWKVSVRTKQIDGETYMKTHIWKDEELHTIHFKKGRNFTFVFSSDSGPNEIAEIPVLNETREYA